MPHRLRLLVTRLSHRFRQHLADLPSRWQQWQQAIRDDPAALWRGPLVRIGGLALAGVLLLIGVGWLIGGLRPAASQTGFEEATPWATLYVACTNPACRAHYTTRQAMDFKDWPMTCQHCGQATVYRGTLCPECKHWYACPPGGLRTCPFCTHGTPPPERRSDTTPSIPDEPW